MYKNIKCFKAGKYPGNELVLLTGDVYPMIKDNSHLHIEWHLLPLQSYYFWIQGIIGFHDMDVTIEVPCLKFRIETNRTRYNKFFFHFSFFSFLGLVIFDK